MPSVELDRLVEIGKLHHEPPALAELSGLILSGRERLTDARKDDLSSTSRFDLAYNAAYAFALAALRWHGYRSDSRYLVFQALPHTLGTSAATWRLLAKCHDKRNRATYDGFVEIDERLLADLIVAADELRNAVADLDPLTSDGP
jgi:hypothetical protein